MVIVFPAETLYVCAAGFVRLPSFVSVIECDPVAVGVNVKVAVGAAALI